MCKLYFFMPMSDENFEVCEQKFDNMQDLNEFVKNYEVEILKIED